ncbi:MAG: hypothetical protein V7678_01525 [Brevundimonas sp.]
MKNLLILSAALTLAACGESAEPPVRPAEPADGGAAIDPTVAVRPGAGPESFVGVWAAEADWCDNSPAATDRVPIRITAERFEGYENRCDITAIAQAGDSYDASLACEAEGMTSRETVNMRVAGDRLTLTWADRGGEPVQLVRCGAEPAPAPDGG